MAPDQCEINGAKCQKTIAEAGAFLKQEKLNPFPELDIVGHLHINIALQ
jgi:hypothetical protein